MLGSMSAGKWLQTVQGGSDIFVFRIEQSVSVTVFHDTV
jgi:hypothetical protein